MRMLMRALVAGVAMLSSLAAAHAGGDLRGSIKDDYAPVAASPTWYLRADFGYAWQGSDTVSVYSPAIASSSISDTWSLGGGIGRYFGRGFRGDVTYEWRGNTDIDAVSTACCSAATQFSMRSQVFLANLYYDFRRGERFNPYIGAGIGFARNETSGGFYSPNGCACAPYDGQTQWNLAWALMAGASFRLDRGVQRVGGIKDSGYVTMAQPGRTHLDIGYRYLNIGDVTNGPNTFNGIAGPKAGNVDAHELRVGLRYDLR
ncbi:MAG: outer membrane beta-barrel protein [Hyphomicrobiaceae bacterium]|nr:outer membrane beta-barrel protein [Hyphomicrobiaceae bacterium]